MVLRLGAVRDAVKSVGLSSGLAGRPYRQRAGFFANKGCWVRVLDGAFVARYVAQVGLARDALSFVFSEKTCFAPRVVLGATACGASVSALANKLTPVGLALAALATGARYAYACEGAVPLSELDAVVFAERVGF